MMFLSSTQTWFSLARGVFHPPLLHIRQAMWVALLGNPRVFSCALIYPLPLALLWWHSPRTQKCCQWECQLFGVRCREERSEKSMGMEKG